MAREHFWAYLKDQNGRPLENAAVKLYLANSSDEAIIFSTATTASSGADRIDQSTWTTGTSGFFDFYVGNELEPNFGYLSNQTFRLKWWADSVTPSAGGEIDYLSIFDNIYQVNETSTTAVKNKLISNVQALNWTEHQNLTYVDEVHGYKPVQTSDYLGTELITNGDMELNSSWTSAGTGSVSVCEQSSEKKHTGNYSWKTVVPIGSGGVYYINYFPTTTGVTYHYECYVYSTDTHIRFAVKKGADGSTDIYNVDYTIIANEWNKISADVTETAGGPYGSVLIWSSNAATFYVDDVSVKEAGLLPTSTENKLVSNNLLFQINRDLDTFLTCGGDAITISSSGSLVELQTIAFSEWLPSADGSYYVDVNYSIPRNWAFPVYQIYNTDTRDVYWPANVKDIDLETIRIWTHDRLLNIKMTIIGQISSSVEVI